MLYDFFPGPNCADSIHYISVHAVDRQLGPGRRVLRARTKLDVVVPAGPTSASAGPSASSSAADLEVAAKSAWAAAAALSSPGLGSSDRARPATKAKPPTPLPPDPSAQLLASAAAELARSDADCIRDRSGVFTGATKAAPSLRSLLCCLCIRVTACVPENTFASAVPEKPVAGAKFRIYFQEANSGLQNVR